jgi:hypothetical protein
MKKKKKMKYCKKHKQYFEKFLDWCPICIGEVYGKMNKLGLPYTIPKKAVKGKKK